MLRMFQFNPQWHEDLHGDGTTPERRMAAYTQMVQAAVQNATAVAHAMHQQQMSQLIQELNPHIAELTHLADTRFFDEVYDGHKPLKSYEPVLRQLMPQFRQDPNFPKARHEQPAWLRKQFIELQKKADPNFNPVDPTEKPGNVTPFKQPSQVTQHAKVNNLATGTGGGGSVKATPGATGANQSGEMVNPSLGF